MLVTSVWHDELQLQEDVTHQVSYCTKEFLGETEQRFKMDSMLDEDQIISGPASLKIYSSNKP